VIAPLQRSVRRPAPTSPAPAPPGHRRLGLGRDRALLVHRRSALVAVGTGALLVVVVGLSLGAGSSWLGPVRALEGLLGLGPARDQLLVGTLRWPRVEAGLVAGAALGAAGLLMQTLARNRLATPDTVGINNGATAFAVAGVVAVATSAAPSALALTGAATAAAIAFGLAGGSGPRGYRFLVVGLGVGAVFGAITNLVLSRADVDAAGAALPWTLGSLGLQTPPAVVALEVGLLVCLPAAVALSRHLAALRFPEPVAVGLGSPVRRVRVGVLALAVVLAGLAVGVAGPIGMVALVAPEAARRLTGPGTAPVLCSALTGSLFVLLADLVGRTAFLPLEIPAGLVTAVVGGPYLLWLLLTTRTRRSP